LPVLVKKIDLIWFLSTIHIVSIVEVKLEVIGINCIDIDLTVELINVLPSKLILIS
jgi:hypothetical protein